MTVNFEIRTVIDAPLSVVFDLARDIDVHEDSQADAGERAIGGVTSGLIDLGEDVTWRARHFGVPFTMTSRVTALEAPSRFVDEQVRGPFARFHHEHLFHSEDGVGNVMVDRVEFAAPLGAVGRIVERLLLANHLEKLLRNRAKFLKDLAEAG